MRSAIAPDLSRMGTETADTPHSLALTRCRVLALVNGIELFGLEKASIEIFKALRDAGADVEVGITPKEDGGDVGAYLRAHDFATFPVPFGCQWSKTFFRDKPSLIAACARDVVRASYAFLRKCRSYRPTHVHLGNSLAYSYVAPALAVLRVPVVFTVNNEPPVKSRPNLSIWKRCVARADAVVAVSEFIGRRILDVNPSAANKTRTIYNLAPLGRGAPNIVNSGADKRHIVFVGQIAEHKGVLPLLDAAMSLVTQRADVVFDIVGGSRYSRDLEWSLRAKVDAAELQDRIRFHGYVKDPSEYYTSATLHVVPSLWEEPLGIVVLEAKRTGTPSVVFPSGGLPEMIRHKIDGFVCRERSAEALTEAILWFLDSPERLAAARTAALDDHVSRFGRARFVDQWAQVHLGCSRNR